MTTQSYGGLLCKEVFISNGSIMMQTDRVDQDLYLGDVETLLSLPHYEDGVYETENGLTIDLREYIEHLALPPEALHKLRKKSSDTTEGEKLSNRMIGFNRLLVDRLEGDIKYESES